MSLNSDSPIVKCSHCKEILSAEKFEVHECEMPVATVKEIPVAYFRDDSHGNKSIMIGRGLDGILYAFIVTPRTAIPYFKRLTDEKKQQFRTDEEEPVPKSAILNSEIANFHNTTGEFVDNGKVQSNRFRPRSWNFKSGGD